MGKHISFSKTLAPQKHVTKQSRMIIPKSIAVHSSSTQQTKITKQTKNSIRWAFCIVKFRSKMYSLLSCYGGFSFQNVSFPHRSAWFPEHIAVIFYAIPKTRTDIPCAVPPNFICDHNLQMNIIQRFVFPRVDKYHPSLTRGCSSRSMSVSSPTQ